MNGASFRVVTWNLKDLTGDPQAIRAVLKALDGDIYCLQEVPRRLGASWRLNNLLRPLNLTPAAAGRGSGGTAIVIAPQVRLIAASILPLPVAHWYDRRRGAASATVELGPGHRVQVASVHLPLTAQQRAEHAALIVDRVGRAAHRLGVASVVICGDFNETPGPLWQQFAALASDPAPEAGPSFPARSPAERLDAVLVGNGLDVLRYGTPGQELTPAAAEPGLICLIQRASDHLPVIADLAFADVGG